MGRVRSWRKNNEIDPGIAGGGSGATDLDETERNRAVLYSIVETIEAEQRDKADWIETINTRLDALKTGGKTYSLDEAWGQLNAM